MKGSELIRKIENLAKKQHLTVEFRLRRGKGSHGTLIFGGRFAVVPDVKKGTMAAILKQLEIDKSQLE